MLIYVLKLALVASCEHYIKRLCCKYELVDAIRVCSGIMG